jgi:SpoVK/Ycf46/Vps4 family AAA+-type ATPase
VKSEDITKIFEAFMSHDMETFNKTAMGIIKSEENKNHHLLADGLRNILERKFKNGRANPNLQTPPIPRDNEKGFKLLTLKEYFLGWSDIILDSNAEESLKQVVEEVEKENTLATYGLKPKQKILFYGPPGTGKTLSAKILSSVIGYPIVLVNFESIISSYLGETSSNLRKVFDFIEKGRWLVLFDEFDIIGKQRDDPTEHGEIKRVVNNFMLMLEHYEGESIIVAASNHPHLLDIGIWRRFDDIVYFGVPVKAARKKIFKKYLNVMNKEKDIDINKLGNETTKFSGSDIEQVCLEALKRTILTDKKNILMVELQRSIAKQRTRLKARSVKIYARRTP